LNPNSAIERVKNHLAYKLGQTVIEHRHNGGGYIALFKKLYKIKKQHKKEQKIYQQTIQVFPQLKYPSLETCPDYNEALRCKFHLSYMIGEVLIKAYQNWYKGGGFKLKNNIKKANKEFQIFREILKEFKELNGETLKAIQDNKQLFLKEFPRIKNILKTHQDYQPILDNIFHNFNYFIKNFDLIEEWLLSDDFKEKYKKENHPYPSLLDPKKLNDENEKINYHNIPAELAWKMNLPLPPNYEFMWFFSHGAGAFTLGQFFYHLFKINILDYFCGGDGDIRYYKFYNKLLELKDKRNIITINDIDPSWYGNQHKRDKLFSSFQKITPILFQIRDPIELIKHAYGRKWGNNLAKTKEFDLSYQFNDIITEVEVYNYNLPNTLEGQRPQSFLWKSLIECFDKFNDCFYLDISKIRGEETIHTLNYLSNKFNLKQIKINDKEFVTKSYFKGNLYFLLPLTLYLNKEDLNTNIPNKKINKNNSLIININFFQNDNNLFNLYSELSILDMDSSVGFYIDKQDYNKLKNDSIFYKQVIDYLRNFAYELKNRIQIEEDLMLKVEDVLRHLYNNKNARVSAKNILDEELVYIKQHRPDIVASWKYYQEFEKMCKELDGDI
ncbi:DUF2972 domain-containing protein, partial [Campylobacter jejuni]|nr:DUF2972 domain-containing protein [Campylobacter jejuni]